MMFACHEISLMFPKSVINQGNQEVDDNGYCEINDDIRDHHDLGQAAELVRFKI